MLKSFIVNPIIRHARYRFRIFVYFGSGFLCGILGSNLVLPYIPYYSQFKQFAYDYLFAIFLP